MPGSPGGAEQQQREAEPAGGPGALARGAVRSVDGRRPCLQRSRRRPAAAPRRGPSAARRSWSRRRARSAGCRRRWPPPARRRPTAPGPAPGRPCVASRSPARRRGRADASAVAPERGEQARYRRRWCPTAAEPDHDAWRLRRRPPRRAARPRRTSSPPRRARVPVRCRPHACALSTYAVSPHEQHRRRRRLAERPAHRDREQLAARAPRAARRRSPGRRRPSAPGRARRPGPGGRQPVGDRLGRLDGGEGAGELVRRDQDSHALHPARVTADVIRVGSP